MVKLIKIDEDTPQRSMWILYADSTEDIEEFDAYEQLGVSGEVPVGSVVYTADLDVAVFNSNGEWHWVGSSENNDDTGTGALDPVDPGTLNPFGPGSRD